MNNYLSNLPDDIQLIIWMSVHKNHLKDLHKDIKIEYVLSMFKGMGATKLEIHRDRIKLKKDTSYYNQWCQDLSSWLIDYV